MKRLSILLFCLLLATGCQLNSPQKAPLAKNGVLDLRGWDFEKNGTVRLDGEWEFYWEQLLQPKDFINTPPVAKTGYITVPGNWNGYEVNGKKLNGNGFATYRLVIKVDPKVDLLAFKLPSISTAYKMWINSHEASSNGIVGKNRATMTPEYAPNVTALPNGAGTIDLVIQASNFVHRKGGMWRPIEFGQIKQINKIREENLVIEFFLFGSIFIMGFYHLGLFLLRKKERSTLYFGVFCLLVALRVVLTGERILHLYGPWLGWQNLVRLEYLTFYLAAPIFVVFLGNLFPEFSQKIVRIAGLLGLITGAIVLFTDSSIFTHTLTFVQIMSVVFTIFVFVSFIRAIIHKREGAGLLCLGSALLISSLFHDILIANGVFHSINLAAAGLFLFIFVQSVMLSIRFSKAFTMAEDLSMELEEKVELRTQGLQKANKEIALSNKMLRETQSQLIQSQKMEAMGTLAGGIAHDFNNILGTILGYSELLLNDQAADSPIKEHLHAIYRSGERAADLVRQILTFSRGDTQDLAPMQIQPSLKETLNMIRATLPESIEIRDRIDPECGPIMANQTQISQVLLNLCNNANFAMKASGGVLDIGLKETVVQKNRFLEAANDKGVYLQLSVSDTGSGMADEVLNRIYDPFFTTKKVNEGSGLGLSIVHGIVKNHQGFIDVESQIGKGTRFDIYFPITIEKAAAESSHDIAPKKGTGNILIVEDDRELARFYAITLEKTGYQTKLFYNGEEALEYFRKQADSFDLVFSDQIMSKMNGFEMSLEMLAIRPEIPIILATGYTTVLTEQEVLNAGIARFLTKPIRASELTQKIWELTQSKSVSK
jgi:signal transduction histidine kinase/CheY-like chemotaxis protein